MGGYAVYYVVAALAAVSYDQAERQEDKSHEQTQRARAEQRQARAEQGAQNEAQRAAERRRQLREERVKRAKMIQAGINTGTEDSSGILGGEANLATQRGSGIGLQLGMEQSADNISMFEQNAANWLGGAQGAMNKSNQWQNTSNMFLNMAVSGAGSKSSTPSGTTPQQTDVTNGGQYSDAPRGIFGG